MKAVLIYLVNIILVFLIMTRVFVIDNDKAHLIFAFYYPALMVLNLLVGLGLKLMRRKVYKVYLQLCVWMGCLFIPIYGALILI